LIISAIGSLFTNAIAPAFTQIQGWLVANMGWFYLLVVGFFFIFVVYLAISRYSGLRLGTDDSQPDYNTFSWFAMLFSAGMGIGLMFFGVAEPVTHAFSPPLPVDGAEAANRQAMLLTLLNWGFQAWAVYIVVALSLAYFCFRCGLPLTFRSTLYPLLGERIKGRLGDAVDVFAILGTLFGVATSLGLGVLQINAGLAYLFDVPVSETIQVVLILSITAVATLSVVAGLDAGIRRLSILNIVLAVFLMLFVFVTGPTLTLISSLFQNITNYVIGVIPANFNLYRKASDDWMGGWTLFYWAWWIPWSPFVGMFIARISKGRTIREFILGVMLLPMGFTCVWMTVFGNTALALEVVGQGQSVVEAVQNNLPTAIFVLLEQLPLSFLTSMIAALLIVTFFVTSSDSGSLVIDIIASNGDLDPPRWRRVFWAVTQGVVAAVLLAAGGLTALQTATIASALPLAIIMLFICIGLMRSLRNEESI